MRVGLHNDFMITISILERTGHQQKCCMQCFAALSNLDAIRECVIVVCKLLLPALCKTQISMFSRSTRPLNPISPKTLHAGARANASVGCSLTCFRISSNPSGPCHLVSSWKICACCRSRSVALAANSTAFSADCFESGIFPLS